jgi:hypothetical protein
VVSAALISIPSLVGGALRTGHFAVVTRLLEKLFVSAPKSPWLRLVQELVSVLRFTPVLSVNSATMTTRLIAVIKSIRMVPYGLVLELCPRGGMRAIFVRMRYVSYCIF